MRCLARRTPRIKGLKFFDNPTQMLCALILISKDKIHSCVYASVEYVNFIQIEHFQHVIQRLIYSLNEKKNAIAILKIDVSIISQQSHNDFFVCAVELVEKSAKIEKYTKQHSRRKAIKYEEERERERGSGKYNVAH